MWKKVLYISLAVLYSLVLGTSRFLIGAHSIDQVIFGWLLGAWLAISYFTIIRSYVHVHVNQLTTGHTTSSSKVFYLASTGIWVAVTTIVTITFLVSKNKDIRFPDGSVPAPSYADLWVCAKRYTYWSTWSDSAYISSGLGGYFGILYQHKKYGGQLFIQQKFD